MKTKPILVLFVISFLIFNQHCFSQDHQVDLMKVTNTTGTDHPDLPYWKAAGVSLTGRQDTYISIVSEPPRDQVKRVVFISAGQQSDNPMPWKDLLSSNYGEGYTNVLTGQPDNYKEGFRGANELEKKKMD